MENRSPFHWKRITTFVILIYGALKFSGHFYSIIFAHYTSDNPLIPEYLDNYIAFPHYFFIPLWGVALWLGWLFYRRGHYKTQRFWYIVIGLVFMMLLEGTLYQLLMKFNPYG